MARKSNATAAFSEWLTRTFSDFYLVQRFGSTDFRIVEHLPTTDNEKFIELLCQIYDRRDFKYQPYVTSPGAFIFRVEGGEIVIQPYDELIHHTQYVKEVPHD